MSRKKKIRIQKISHHESLTLPILRVFYPKLVAKEDVTVSPMDKPEHLILLKVFGRPGIENL